MSQLKQNFRPQNWDSADEKILRQIHGVCFDIDDTFSTQGKLTVEAFSALWDLKNAGFATVAITGRPAGWCDHIARFWPVDAVIGENGAFTFFMEGGIRKRIDTPQRKNYKSDLNQLAEKIIIQFPQVKWASDQSYRENDLAVDICEDVEPWEIQKVHALIAFCKAHGAHAKLSSIHVNIWFGNYDKQTGFKYWLSQKAPGLKHNILDGILLENWIYIGDSPNDEPLFSSFKYSVGVANLSAYLSQITNFPTWMTSKESGAGFAQMARKLTSLKLD